MKNKSIGFTLLELLIVMAILGIMASVLTVIINPARQLAKARDTQRQTDLFAILAAVYQYSSEHSGALPDTDGDPETSNFPATPTCIGTGGGCFNLAGAGEAGDEIVPVYMAAMPFDPKFGDASDTMYLVYVDENNHLIASASGETRDDISYTR